MLKPILFLKNQMSAKFSLRKCSASDFLNIKLWLLMMITERWDLLSVLHRFFFFLMDKPKSATTRPIVNWIQVKILVEILILKTFLIIRSDFFKSEHNTTFIFINRANSEYWVISNCYRYSNYFFTLFWLIAFLIVKGNMAQVRFSLGREESCD